MMYGKFSLQFNFLADDYRSMTSAKVKEAEQNQSSAPSVKSVNPFDNLDCELVILC